MQELININILKVKFSYPFSVRNGFSEALFNSIKNIGLAAPPKAIANNNDILIISGKRRINILKKLKHKKINIILYNPNTPDKDLFRINIQDDISSNIPYTISEKATLYKKMKKFGFNNEEILKIFQEIKIPQKYESKIILEKINKMPKDIQLWIDNKNFPFGFLDFFLFYGVEELIHLFNKILIPFNSTASESLQMASYIFELSKKEKINIIKIINQVSEQSKNKNQILNTLKIKRNPITQKIIEEKNKILKDIYNKTKILFKIPINSPNKLIIEKNINSFEEFENFIKILNNEKPNIMKFFNDYEI